MSTQYCVQIPSVVTPVTSLSVHSSPWAVGSLNPCDSGRDWEWLHCRVGETFCNANLIVVGAY